MGIKKLLFVSEFKQLWFDALQSLMDLKKNGLDHVIFLHVIDREKVAMHRGVGYLKSEEVKLKEIANVRFIDWAEHLFEQGMEVGAHIVVGNIVPKVLTISQEEDVGLIVIGYHEKDNLMNLYSSSETIDIMRMSKIPVLVHKYLSESGKKNDSPFNKPLIAMDWSPACYSAVDFLINIKEIISKVQVIHVASEKSLISSSSMSVQNIRKKNKKKLDEVCDMFRTEGIEVENHLYVGGSINQIERAAEERQASMIVVGKTRKSSIREKFFGSFPSDLVKNSDLPVLIVPKI